MSVIHEFVADWEATSERWGWEGGGEVLKQTFLSCWLHLSFYGQQQGPSLPLMDLTAYLSALHSLVLNYSLYFKLLKWALCVSSVETGSGRMALTYDGTFCEDSLTHNNAVNSMHTVMFLHYSWSQINMHVTSNSIMKTHISQPLKP